MVIITLGEGMQIEMSAEAAECVAEVGGERYILDDVERVRRGLTRENFLLQVLDGVDPSDSARVRGWTDYVDAVIANVRH